MSKKEDFMYDPSIATKCKFKFRNLFSIWLSSLTFSLHDLFILIFKPSRFGTIAEWLYWIFMFRKLTYTTTCKTWKHAYNFDYFFAVFNVAQLLFRTLTCNFYWNEWKMLENLIGREMTTIHTKKFIELTTWLLLK